MDIGNAKRCIADLKQQLLIADTRCCSLKSQLDYMKMLYHDVRPEGDEIKEIIASPKSPNEESLSKKLPLLSPKAMFRAEDEDAACKEADVYAALLEKIHEHQYGDNIELSKQSPRTSPKMNSFLPAYNLECDEAKRTQEVNMHGITEVDLLQATPRTYIPPLNSHAFSKTVLPICEERTPEEDLNDWQRASRKSSAERSSNFQENERNSKRSFEGLASESQLLQELASVRKDIIRNIGGSVKNCRIVKKRAGGKASKERIISSSLTSKKGSLCKVEDVALKLKRKKGKVRCSNSKSTVTTKDTNLIRKKEIRKRKQRDGTSNRSTGILKQRQTSSEVVEIYHNAAAKSGTSVLSNKQLKFDHRSNILSKPSITLNEQKNASAKSTTESNMKENNSRRIRDQENHQISPRESFQSKKRAEVKNSNVCNQDCKLETTIVPICSEDKYNYRHYQDAMIQPSYCDSMVAHNYEMPTLASKLKRANRSYFSRFNFRNIPFVVGTSVTPSHNLGLNIQQVLSIMKTRQPSINGITPLLIRKMSRGMKPVSALMEQINDQYKLSDINSKTASADINPQAINSYETKEGLLVEKSENLTENELLSKHGRKISDIHPVELKTSSAKENQSFREITSDCKNDRDKSHGQKDTLSENQLNKYRENGRAFIPNGNRDSVNVLKPFASQQNVKSRVEFLSATKTQSSMYNDDFYAVTSAAHSRSSKGIQEVLVNLHDQFEEMNMRYEKLQAQLEKSNDRAMEDEISSLEKELNAKEDEINAVVSLYKEVMALKHQMKLLQEKNSFVCISTEVPMNPNKAYSSVPLTLSKPYSANLQRNFQQRKGNSFAVSREPSTSIRLAGLLRQIQMFQKQLKLTSS